MSGSILDTAADVASFLDEQAIPYAIIGGLAVQYWGEPRTTRDVDIVVLVAPDRIDSFLAAAVNRYKPRLQDAIAFAQENRVLLIWGEDETPVDIALGLPGYEEEAIRRAATVSIGGRRNIRLISREDLIIHKCIAGRPRDREDIERVLVRQQLTVDLDYIRQWLRQFAELMESNEVAAVFEDALERARAEVAQDE